MMPAAVAIVATSDQPHALSSSPRSVSPWNSDAFWPASLALVGSACAAVLTCA